MNYFLGLAYFSFILSRVVHTTNAVSKSSGKGMIDLNTTPPASPQSDADNQSVINNVQNSPHEIVNTHNAAQMVVDQPKVLKAGIRKHNKIRSVPFKKVESDKSFKYQFPPGTTYDEKKKVWNKARYDRIKQDPERSSKLALYHRIRNQNLTEVEKQDRRDQQKRRYHRLSPEQKQKNLRRIAQSNKERRKAKLTEKRQKENMQSPVH